MNQALSKLASTEATIVITALVAASAAYCAAGFVLDGRHVLLVAAAAAPEQAAAVTKALQSAQVHPPLAELIGNLLRHGPAALTGPPDVPDTPALISLLEAAATINKNPERLNDLAYDMGRPAYRHSEIEDWIDLHSE